MLASDLPAGTIAVLQGTIAEGATSVKIPFTIAPGDFKGPNGSRATLIFSVSSADGSPAQLARTVTQLRVDRADLRLAQRNLGIVSTVGPLSVALRTATADDPSQIDLVDQPATDLSGQTLPNTRVVLTGGPNDSVDMTTVSNAAGQFQFTNVPLAVGANFFTASGAGGFGQKADAKLTVTRDASASTPLTAQERMVLFGLTDIKGLCYTPEPSDDIPPSNAPAPPPYFDSDFWGAGFEPMWSSETNIPGFQTADGGPVNGRGDLATFQSLGVNFLHLYDWNPARDHSAFLANVAADGMTVNVPISNYVFDLAMNPPLLLNTYVTQLQFVQQIFSQVYPNLGSGDFKPAAGVSMWTIANEPDNSGGNILPGQVAQVAQMILYLENQANIPDNDRLPIAVPFSWATSWVGTSYSNPTPSVGAVEAFFNATQNTTPFAATDLSNTQVTVPPLPADFFTTRFVWANNPIGNDNHFFLGVRTPPSSYAPYNNPAGASSQIDWSTIPMFFTEDGPSSAQPPNDPTIQATILQQELSDVSLARSSGNDPNFDGACVFQSLDQLAFKTGSETGFGITTFQTGVYQTINDTDPNLIPAGGTGTWRLDTLVNKPAFDVVQQAFAPSTQATASASHRATHHRV
jgi:hypothetical protein